MMLKASGIPVVEIMDIDGSPVDAMVGISPVSYTHLTLPTKA